MPAEDNAIIRIRNLHKYFGQVQALRGIEMDVERGSVVVILGPSGSGKSTLLRCINHLEVETEGEVWVDGRPLSEQNKDINEIRAEIGMVFQLFNLFPHLTAIQNIILAQKVVRG
ncbi:MAG: ATP-binding cassette domain-containing protein, partial [Anaerolineales bacterium]